MSIYGTNDGKTKHRELRKKLKQCWQGAMGMGKELEEAINRKRIIKNAEKNGMIRRRRAGGGRKAEESQDTMLLKGWYDKGGR